jgi:TonB family protein
LPSALRGAFGVLFAIGLALGTGYAAWASQPARAGESQAPLAEDELGLRIVLRFDEKAVLTYEGVPKVGDDGLGFGLDFTVTALAGNEIEVAGTAHREGRTLSQPSLRFRRGDVASVMLSGEGLPENASFDFFYGTAREWLDHIPPDLQAQPRNPDDASYQRLTPPKYPAAALADRAEGTVLLRVLVAIDGSPAEVRIERSSGDARLDAAAQNKVRDWRFNPARREGQAIAGWVQVPVTFSLDGEVWDTPPLPPGALDEIYIKAPQG